MFLHLLKIVIEVAKKYGVFDLLFDRILECSSAGNSFPGLRVPPNLASIVETVTLQAAENRYAVWVYYLGLGYVEGLGGGGWVWWGGVYIYIYAYNINFAAIPLSL